MDGLVLWVCWRGGLDFLEYSGFRSGVVSVKVVLLDWFLREGGSECMV